MNGGTSEVRKWALTRSEGQPTTKDMLELVMAVDADNEARHQESLQLLREHIIEAEQFFSRVANLEQKMLEFETWRRDQTANCAERIKRLIHEEHEQRHSAYMATISGDDEAQFHDRLVWFFATVTGKVVLVVLGVILAIVLNVLVYGHP